LRREEIEIDGSRLHVRKSKSVAGTERRPPIAEPLRKILRTAASAYRSEPNDPVAPASVMSGKIANRGQCVGGGRSQPDHPPRVPAHLRQRYTKLLPQSHEHDPADRLNAYLRSRRTS
jgi:hypothetical protein